MNKVNNLVKLQKTKKNQTRYQDNYKIICNNNSISITNNKFLKLKKTKKVIERNCYKNGKKYLKSLMNKLRFNFQKFRKNKIK